MIRFISWNVNGLRACLKKGFTEYFKETGADFFCIQETKAQPEQIDLSPDGYDVYVNSAEKKGYSGTAIVTKHRPLNVRYGLGFEEHDREGRVITLEMEDFFLVNVYVPNSKEKLARLDYRMVWEDVFRSFIKDLDKRKPVIICGDMNVAHQEIDLKNPKTNHRSAGFTDEERGKMTALLDAGFTDTFRALYPERADVYTWWSYRTHARKTNAGWRIDYFIISDRWMDKVEDSRIHDHIFGSDHCPVELVIRD